MHLSVFTLENDLFRAPSLSPSPPVPGLVLIPSKHASFAVGNLSKLGSGTIAAFSVCSRFSVVLSGIVIMLSYILQLGHLGRRCFFSWLCCSVFLFSFVVGYHFLLVACRRKNCRGRCLSCWGAPVDYCADHAAAMT